MKYISFLLSLFFTGIMFAQDYRGAVSVDLSSYAERNDSLIVRFEIRVESNAVPSYSSIYFTPELRTSNNTVDLPYVQLNSKVRSKINARWFTIASDRWLSLYNAPEIVVNTSKYTEERMYYSVAIPYESWMDNAQLHLRQELIGYRSQVSIYSYKLSDQVIKAPRAPYQVQPQVAFVTPTDGPKTRNRQGSAFLDFQVGRSVILPDFRRNPAELGKINDAFWDVMTDDARITGLFIEGYASPEGRATTNEKLAYDRANALKEYIKTNFKLDERMFTVRSGGEDWTGLKTAVEAGSFPQKEQVLAIIDSNAALDAKEAQLKRLSVYSTLLRDVFPELRRVEYQIDYSVRNYTTAEAKELMHTPKPVAGRVIPCCPGVYQKSEIYTQRFNKGRTERRIREMHQTGSRFYLYKRNCRQKPQQRSKPIPFRI